METVNTISVIGLGKLGLPIALCLAQAGYDVVGVDTNIELLKQIQQGQSPIYEPGVQELLQETRIQRRFTATSQLDEAIRQSQATFIVVPTPSQADGSFSPHYIQRVCVDLGKELRQKQDFHLVNLVSTTTPGSMDDYIVPWIEITSAKRCGKDLGICYNPEFMALGTVIQDFQNPAFVLIGQSDKATGDVLARIYRQLFTYDSCAWLDIDPCPTIVQTSLVEAEIIKLGLNFGLTVKISLANLLAQICEQMPGANVDRVTQAIGLDPRIGPEYLMGGAKAAGPCFPRDIRAMEALTQQLGIPSDLPRAVSYLNENEMRRLEDIVKVHLSQALTVGILGLSYKPGTDVVEDSPGISLAKRLVWHRRVLAHDPAAIANAKKIAPDAEYTDNIEWLLLQSDVVVITVPWPEYKNIEHLFHNQIVIDVWRILDPDELDISVKYIPIGVGL